MKAVIVPPRIERPCRGRLPDGPCIHPAVADGALAPFVRSGLYADLQLCPLHLMARLTRALDATSARVLVAERKLATLARRAAECLNDTDALALVADLAEGRDP